MLSMHRPLRCSPQLSAAPKSGPKMTLQASLGCLALLLCCARGLDNGLARTPQMGWAPWNTFGVHISESLMREHADKMVDLNLAKLGYQYLCVDDAWSELQRDAEGHTVANKATFPSGMKALGDYAHSKGLKYGIYSDAGSATCAGYPGSRGYEDVDAQDFTSWGIDYLKYDNCNCQADDPIVERFTAMSEALNKTGRPVLYSMCIWGTGDAWRWAAQVGNSWRTTADISAWWDAMLRCLDNTVGLARFAGPGHWNDLDMLEVGVGMTWPEQRSHFALWCLLKSPLLISADLRVIAPEALSILSAEELIAVNQDPLGVAGDLIWKEGPLEVYAGPLVEGTRAVVLFNRHTPFPFVSNLTVQFSSLGFHADAKATVRDLYTGKDLGTFQGEFTAAVEPHDVCVVKITPEFVRPEYDLWRPWHQAGRTIEQATLDSIRHSAAEGPRRQPLLQQGQNMPKAEQ